VKKQCVLLLFMLQGVTGPSGYPSLTVNNSNVNQQNHINALYNQKQ